MIKFIKQVGTSDCYNACLASLTGIPIGAFPVGAVDDEDSVNQWNECQKVLYLHGWMALETWPPRVPASYAIASGPSPRGDWDHSIIIYDGAPYFDPHPSNDFLAAKATIYIVLIQLVAAPSGDHGVTREKLEKIIEDERISWGEYAREGYDPGSKTFAEAKRTREATTALLDQLFRDIVLESTPDELREALKGTGETVEDLASRGRAVAERALAISGELPTREEIDKAADVVSTALNALLDRLTFATPEAQQGDERELPTREEVHTAMIECANRFTVAYHYSESDNFTDEQCRDADRESDRARDEWDAMLDRLPLGAPQGDTKP